MYIRLNGFQTILGNPPLDLFPKLQLLKTFFVADSVNTFPRACRLHSVTSGLQASYIQATAKGVLFQIRMIIPFAILCFPSVFALFSHDLHNKRHNNTYFWPFLSAKCFRGYLLASQGSRARINAVLPLLIISVCRRLHFFFWSVTIKANSLSPSTIPTS